MKNSLKSGKLPGKMAKGTCEGTEGDDKFVKVEVMIEVKLVEDAADAFYADVDDEDVFVEVIEDGKKPRGYRGVENFVDNKPRKLRGVKSDQY